MYNHVSIRNHILKATHPRQYKSRGKKLLEQTKTQENVSHWRCDTIQRKRGLVKPGGSWKKGAYLSFIDASERVLVSFFFFYISFDSFECFFYFVILLFLIINRTTTEQRCRSLTQTGEQTHRDHIIGSGRQRKRRWNFYKYIYIFIYIVDI